MQALKIVSQVGLVSIGFDCAPIGCDIDAKPSGSLTDWVQRRGRHKRAFPTPQGDRSYQLDLINRSRDSIRAGRKPMIVMGCGAGKSHLACLMAQSAHAKGKAIGFLTVRRALVKDLSSRLDRFGVPHGIVMDGYTDNAHRTKVVSIHTAAARDLTLDVDLLFLDEAHLYLSPAFKAVVDRHAHIPRIGLSASPGRSDGQPMRFLADELLLGPSTQDLIDRGFLVTTRVFIAGNPEVTDTDLASEDRCAEIMNKPGLNGNIVKQWIIHGQNRPTIIHAVNVAHSKAIVERFLKAGIEAVHIDADTPDAEREAVFARLAENAPAKQDAILIDCAGNSLRFGHCDDDPQWSLDSDGTPSVKPRDNALSIRHCKACLFAFKSAIDSCPNCGAKHIPTLKKIIERDMEMTEMKRTQKAAAIDRYASQATDEQKIAKLAEYLQTAQVKNYRKGWAFGRWAAVFKQPVPQHIIRAAYNKL